MNNERFLVYYEMLNKEQKEAVDAIDGPILILAGPGTGKTQLLSVRTANIVKQKKCAPDNILILTFTNAAARAMRERLALIIGHEGYNVDVETFHGFANSIVLESENAIKFVKNKIEISEVEKIRAIEYILDNDEGVEGLRPFGAPYIHRREIEGRISELKKEDISPEDFKRELKSLKPDGINVEEKHISRLKALSILYDKYEALKDTERTVLFDERGRIDYDDMILVAIEALKKDEGLRDSFREQYRYIMVDEYQDTNGAQLDLLFSILDPEKKNLCCVGDDDQAIYRFQGAALSNFRVLKEKLAELRVISLSKNYRSTKKIVDFSQEIIGLLDKDERVAEKKFDACGTCKEGNVSFSEFLTEEEELSFLVTEVRRQAERIREDANLSEENKKKPFNNIAVLVRKRKQILKVIDAFLKAGIPYATDGKEDIRREKRVRQMLDVLELARIDLRDTERKSLALYKVLSADYTEIPYSDIVSFIAFVNAGKMNARKEQGFSSQGFNLFEQFSNSFFDFKKDADGNALFPEENESRNLDIAKKVRLKNAHAMHTGAWAIHRVLTESDSRPVHDILMQFISDMRLYNFILKRYEQDKIFRLRELRALVSFINMIKQADLADPALKLSDMVEELELRETHGMPVQGELATLSQDGVRIYTAHASKGLEFYSVFVPFCLERKSWPLRAKPDVVPLPSLIYKSKERLEEKSRIKLLNLYDELRLFYVTATRAKANIIYTFTPAEKVIISSFLSRLNVKTRKASPPDEERFLVEYLKKRTVSDVYEEVPAALKDLVGNISLNPTSLNNYISCPRKFLHDNILRLPGKKNQNLVFGNCCHKALEEAYSFYMKKGKGLDFEKFKAVFKREMYFYGVNDAIRSGCMSKLERLRDWYEKEFKCPVMPLDLENRLEIFLPGGIVFKGTFDKIEEEDENTIRVIDYKTGKPDKHVKAIANCRDLFAYECDDYYRQLVAYKMLYERAISSGTGKKVVKGVLQFLEPVGVTVKKYGLEKGAYHKEIVFLPDEKVEELEKVITRCWRDIQDLNFDKLSERDEKERCKWCEYDALCWQN
ncbi:MAG: ATP-dependent DNA helicase [Candidatus Omnitrophota bacterium]